MGEGFDARAPTVLQALFDLVGEQQQLDDEADAEERMPKEA